MSSGSHLWTNIEFLDLPRDHLRMRKKTTFPRLLTLLFIYFALFGISYAWLYKKRFALQDKDNWTAVAHLAKQSWRLDKIRSKETFRHILQQPVQLRKALFKSAQIIHVQKESGKVLHNELPLSFTPAELALCTEEQEFHFAFENNLYRSRHVTMDQQTYLFFQKTSFEVLNQLSDYLKVHLFVVDYTDQRDPLIVYSSAPERLKKDFLKVFDRKAKEQTLILDEEAHFTKKSSLTKVKGLRQYLVPIKADPRSEDSDQFYFILMMTLVFIATSLTLLRLVDDSEEKVS